MNYATITFNFVEGDYNTYKVKINNEKYLVNCDNSSIKTTINKDSTMSVCYESTSVKFIDACLMFLFEFIKLIFFAFFSTTPDNKWYSGAAIYNFNFKYDISKLNSSNYQFQITNSFINSKMDYLKKPNIILIDVADIKTINEQVSPCCYDLQKHLIKYISKLIWLFLILFVIFVLCFNKMVMVLALSTMALTVLVLVLVFLSIKKYKKIVGISEHIT